MSQLHEKRFPNESDEYRKAREELLQAEADLRRTIEKVAALRRNLPLGGKVKKDYIFEEGSPDLSDQTTVKQTRLSDLFAGGKTSLIIYSFMYGPEMAAACPLCTSILDGLNGMVHHAIQRINLAVVAKSPLQTIREWARIRGWSNLRLLSSASNSYNSDYFAETEAGAQLPALNVFSKTDEGIFHFYNTELLYTPAEEGQNPRHVDSIWPLWNLFDLTPEGRGADWYPRLSYSQ